MPIYQGFLSSDVKAVFAPQTIEKGNGKAGHKPQKQRNFNSKFWTCIYSQGVV
jgi:hypothetical protein